MIFNKQKIKFNFNRFSSNYNANAGLQKIVAKKLFDLAKADIKNSHSIIDFGAGTGFLTENILKEFSDKNIFQLDISEEMLNQNPFKTHKIIADIENLPQFDQSFDLGLSSLTMQWVNDLDKTIKSILKILNNKNFYFSIIGSETLKELKESAKTCNVELSINDFIAQKTLNDLLLAQNYNFDIKSEIITMSYKDCFELLKSIKSIGAGYKSNNKILNKTQFKTLNNFYLKNFNQNNMIASTWQIFYVTVK